MSQLLEEILSKDNMTQAYKKVKANKGTCGADGVGMDEIDDYLRKNWKDHQGRNPKSEIPSSTSAKGRDTKAEWWSAKPWNSNSGRPNH